MSASNEISGALAECGDKLTAAEYLAASEDYMAALNHLGVFTDALSETISDLVQAAYDNGATKKAICTALGMPIGALAGLKRSVAV